MFRSGENRKIVGFDDLSDFRRITVASADIISVCFAHLCIRQHKEGRCHCSKIKLDKNEEVGFTFSVDIDGPSRNFRRSREKLSSLNFNRSREAFDDDHDVVTGCTFWAHVGRQPEGVELCDRQ